MKIPPKYQIFEEPIQVSEAVITNLEYLLTGYDSLMLEISFLSELDLKRLVLMELAGKQRMKILSRLMMRIHSHRRLALGQRLRQCLRESPNGK